MNGKSMLFLFNPKSGKEQLRAKLADVLDIFAKAGYEITVHPTQSVEDARRTVAAEGARYDRIVCSGGDGTLNEVASGTMDAGIRPLIGYIPSGSTNDFAQSLGISKNIEESAAVTVGDQVFSCDVGWFNASYFIYVAAFGLFTDVSYQTSHNLKQKFGHSAYVFEGIKSLKDIPCFPMEIEANGETFRDHFMYGTISNSFYIGGVKNSFGEEIDIQLDDGQLEVSLIKYPDNPKELNEILTNLMMPKTLDTDCIYRFQTNHMVCRCLGEEVPWTLDGEYGGSPREVEIGCFQRAMRLLVP